MRKQVWISLALLFFWFSLDMTGLTIGNIHVVDYAWNSMDGVWWGLFLVSLILFYAKEKIGKIILAVFLLMWGVIQYFCHWHYTIFGADMSKIEGYNKYFEKTIHILKPSNTILIPDLYHIVLHILIVVSLISLIIYIVKSKKEN